jgi:membrane-associated phospholipid phosphatase
MAAIVEDPKTDRRPAPGRSRATVWVGGGCLAVLLVLTPFVLVDASTGPDRLDAWIASATHDLVRRHHALLSAAQGVTVLGSMTVLAPLVAAIALLLCWRRLWGQAIVLVAATLVSSLVVASLKVSVGRPRPVFGAAVAHAGGYAFPSGHAASSATVFGVLLVIALPFIAQRFRSFAIAFVLALVGAICASRVLLGVHWMTDVIAGACLGTSLTCVAIEASRTDRVC